MGKRIISLVALLGLAGCEEPSGPPPAGLPGPELEQLPAPKLQRFEIRGRERVEAAPPTPGGAAPLAIAPNALRMAASGVGLLVAAEPLEQAFEQGAAGRDLVIEGTSDRGALERLRQGRADVALIDRTLAADEQGLGLGELVLGHHLLALAVHRDQPLRNLDRERLRRVLTGELRSWRPLNGVDTAIRLLVPMPGPWTDHAAELLIPGDRLWSSARNMKNEVAILDFVARTPEALGVVSARALELQGQARGLAIDGALPDRAAFLSGFYRFGVTLRLVYRRPPTAGVADLLRYLQSDEGRLLLNSVATL